MVVLSFYVFVLFTISITVICLFIYFILYIVMHIIMLEAAGLDCRLLFGGCFCFLFFVVRLMRCRAPT
jgi:hypothetical protein